MSWLDRVEPPVPGSFRKWLEPPDVGGGAPLAGDGSAGTLPPADRLEEAGLAALDRAIRPAGRERGGAFDLLAADAFLTWAAEAALEEEDPEARLDALAHRLAGTPEPG